MCVVAVTADASGVLVVQDCATAALRFVLKHAVGGDRGGGSTAGGGGLVDDSLLLPLDVSASSDGVDVLERPKPLPDVCVMSMVRVEGSSVVVTGTECGLLFAWDVAEGVLLRTYKGHSGAVRCLVTVPNSTPSEPSGKPRKPAKASASAMVCSDAVAACLEAVRVVSGSCDNTVRVWALGGKRPLLHLLRGHTGPVNALTAMPGTP